MAIWNFKNKEVTTVKINNLYEVDTVTGHRVLVNLNLVEFISIGKEGKARLHFSAETLAIKESFKEIKKIMQDRS